MVSRYNASRVGNELCVSPLFLFGGDGPSKANNSVNHTERASAVAQVQDMYGRLSERKDEIIDYCFRVYEKAHPGFIHKTQHDHEARCSQVLLFIQTHMCYSVIHILCEISLRLTMLNPLRHAGGASSRLWLGKCVCTFERTFLRGRPRPGQEHRGVFE